MTASYTLHLYTPLYHQCSCSDDCTGTTKRTFTPGHDARLKGVLIRAYRAGVESGDEAAKADAMTHANKYGWAHFLTKARKPKTAKQISEKVEKPAPTKIVVAKVGRWIQKGFVNEDGNFCYLDKGNSRRVAKQGTFKLI